MERGSGTSCAGDLSQLRPRAGLPRQTWQRSLSDEYTSMNKVTSGQQAYCPMMPHHAPPLQHPPNPGALQRRAAACAALHTDCLQA